MIQSACFPIDIYNSFKSTLKNDVRPSGLALTTSNSVHVRYTEFILFEFHPDVRYI